MDSNRKLVVNQASNTERFPKTSSRPPTGNQHAVAGCLPDSVTIVMGNRLEAHVA
jgi:hypothetical protein